MNNDKVKYDTVYKHIKYNEIIFLIWEGAVGRNGASFYLQGTSSIPSPQWS